MTRHLITASAGTTSISALVIGSITQNNIAWCIGILAGLATIASGYFAWARNKREKKAFTQAEEESKIRMEKLRMETQAERGRAEYYKNLLNSKDAR